MKLQKLLESSSNEIVEEAYINLERIKLRTYKKAETEITKRKLSTLYNKLSQCTSEKSILPMVNYAEKIAEQRYDDGYDLYEVQTAINLLEEAIWKRIFKKFKGEELEKFIGLVSTILGAGKDALARKYVSLATKTKLPTIDVNALFRGEGL